MLNLDALLNSLVNSDRASLIAIPSAEAEAAQRLVYSAPRVEKTTPFRVDRLLNRLRIDPIKCTIGITELLMAPALGRYWCEATTVEQYCVGTFGTSPHRALH
jgi:hypothetical protein